MKNKFNRSDSYRPLDLDTQIKKLSGVKQEAHHKMVNGIIKSMKMQEDEETDTMKLHIEAISRVTLIRQYVQLVVQAHIDEGKQLDKDILYQEITTKLLDNFHHYTKDQLLMIVVGMMGEILMKDV